MKLSTLLVSVAFAAAGSLGAAGDAAAQSSGSAAAAAGFEADTHYRVLSPAQPTSSSGDQVEVAEFFMYSCIHCYNFEPSLNAWQARKPDYVNFIRVPTVWNDLVKLHGQAFYAAQALGKGEEMHEAFFREMHENRNPLGSMDAIVEFFGRFGVDEAATRNAMESFSVHANVQRADELTRRYRVGATPTIVVNGKYVTGPGDAGGYDRLFELIDALAADEMANE